MDGTVAPLGVSWLGKSVDVDARLTPISPAVVVTAPTASVTVAATVAPPTNADRSPVHRRHRGPPDAHDRRVITQPASIAAIEACPAPTVAVRVVTLPTASVAIDADAMRPVTVTAATVTLPAAASPR